MASNQSCSSNLLNLCFNFLYINWKFK